METIFACFFPPTGWPHWLLKKKKKIFLQLFLCNLWGSAVPKKIPHGFIFYSFFIERVFLSASYTAVTVLFSLSSHLLVISPIFSCTFHDGDPPPPPPVSGAEVFKENSALTLSSYALGLLPAGLPLPSSFTSKWKVFIDLALFLLSLF